VLASLDTLFLDDAFGVVIDVFQGLSVVSHRPRSGPKTD